MSGRGTEIVAVAADAQITAAGTGGYLKSYKFSSDTNHADISFEDGAGGTEVWADGLIATTAEGDSWGSHTFGGRGAHFTNDIYLNLTDSPKVCVEFEKE